MKRDRELLARQRLAHQVAHDGRGLKRDGVRPGPAVGEFRRPPIPDRRLVGPDSIGVRTATEKHRHPQIRTLPTALAGRDLARSALRCAVSEHRRAVLREREPETVRTPRHPPKSPLTLHPDVHADP